MFIRFCINYFICHPENQAGFRLTKRGQPNGFSIKGSLLGKSQPNISGERKIHHRLINVAEPTHAVITPFGTDTDPAKWQHITVGPASGYAVGIPSSKDIKMVFEYVPVVPEIVHSAHIFACCYTSAGLFIGVSPGEVLNAIFLHVLSIAFRIISTFHFLFFNQPE